MNEPQVERDARVGEEADIDWWWLRQQATDRAPERGGVPRRAGRVGQRPATQSWGSGGLSRFY